MNRDLEENCIVISEAFVSVLKKHNYHDDPYNLLKNLTRTTEKITKETLDNFIKNLDVAKQIKQELLKITPFNYVGKNIDY